MSEADLSAAVFAYQRGVHDFVKGRPSPKKPREPRGKQELSPAHWHWIGYRVALGIDYLKRRSVWEKLGCPHPEPQMIPRP